MLLIRYYYIFSIVTAFTDLVYFIFRKNNTNFQPHVCTKPEKSQCYCMPPCVVDVKVISPRLVTGIAIQSPRPFHIILMRTKLPYIV